MKKISSYIFKKNKREIATYYLTKKDLRQKKININDAICLVLDAQNKRKAHSFYFRPDEALLVAVLLTETVRRSTKKYSLGEIK
ncbi:MAG: hypothetical protein A2031_08185 [Deltaproteobacteria bacterium RBG_19FT_COMBO_43_11]|nr:MAG: hypothetical protein A2031_08185 [Deltaproteobacteria bacterium RBG_19FT_COMBO_43_11]